MPIEGNPIRISDAEAEQRVEARIPNLYKAFDTFVKNHIPEDDVLPAGYSSFVDATIPIKNGRTIGVSIEVGGGESTDYRIDASNFESRIFVLQDGSAGDNHAESRRRVRAEEQNPITGDRTKPQTRRSLNAQDVDKLMDLTRMLNQTKEVAYKPRPKPSY